MNGATPGAGVDGFRAFISELGYEPPANIEPGRWIPFSANGKRGDSAGRARLFPDLEGGIVHDWRSGESWTWQKKREHPRDEGEQRAWREKVEKARRDAEAEREREATNTAQRALHIWDAGSPADDSHPYLLAKGVRSHGLRVYRGALAMGGMKCEGALIIPARDTSGRLASLSFVSPSGEKRYLAGPRSPGCYAGIGKPAGVLCIAEGYATGASIHEATGHAVAIAFDAGNLEPTARALRTKFPELPLVLCADDDWKTGGNPGLAKAGEAARAVGGTVAVPTFGPDRPEGATDFNDLARLAGPAALVAALEAARAPSNEPEAIPAQWEPPEPSKRAGEVRIARGDSVKVVPLGWYWDGYLPHGKVVLIGGAPGTGKTTLAIALASAITSGGRWPDGGRAEGGDVLVWSGEDSVSDTLAARFQAAGANMERVHFVMDVQTGKGGRPFDPSSDFPELILAARHIPDLRLVIVDPIVMAVAGDSHKNAETRRGLQPLVDFAEQSGAVVLGITHFSKGTQGREPIERITGSLAFAAVARLVLVAAKIDESNGGGRVLVRSKSNLGPDGGGFKYELEQVGLAAGVTTSRVHWGESLDGNARDILAAAEVAPGDTADKEEAQGAAEWLLATLREGNGEMLKSEVVRRGREAGFPERTLQRARERTRAVAKVTGFGAEKRSVWMLPEPSIHASEAPFVPIMPSKLSGTHGTNGGTNGLDVEVF